MECNYVTHLMWFGPGVQVVAQVPVAGPVKNKTKMFEVRNLSDNHLVYDLSENSCFHQ